MATPGYCSAEQSAAIKGKKVLILSHSKWNPAGLPAAAVQNIKSYNGFFIENGAECYLATPNATDDLVYLAYKDNDLISGAIAAPEMYGNNGSQAIADAVKAAGIKFDGVFSHFEMLQPVVGEVAELLGIKHNPYSAYAAARDKFATRQALEAAGLPTPKSIAISTAAEIPAVIEKLGFPMIIKPTSGAGSLGVYKAFNEDDLKEGVERVLNDISNIAFLAVNPSDKQDAPLVVEQLMIPKQFGDLPVGEFDVDLVVWDSKLVYGSVTDNWFPIKPYYLENGNTFPSLVEKSVQQELIDYCFKCVLALGFYKGVYHMEAIYTEKDGPLLIECNPRVGGGPVVENNRKMRGVELPYEHMISTLNVPVAPKVKESGKCLVVYYLNCPKTGTLEKADFLQFLENDPDVLRTAYFVKDGQEVKGYDTQVPMWIGEIAMEGPVAEQERLWKKMVKVVEQANENIKVKKEEARRASRRPSLLEGSIGGLTDDKEEFRDT